MVISCNHIMKIILKDGSTKEFHTWVDWKIRDNFLYVKYGAREVEYEQEYIVKKLFKKPQIKKAILKKTCYRYCLFNIDNISFFDFYTEAEK